MKKLKYLLFLFLLIPLNVHAAQIDSWISDYTRPINGWGFDCSSYNKCSTSALSTYPIYFSNNRGVNENGGFEWPAKTVSGSGGTIGIFASDTIFSPDILYSVRIAVCNNKSNPVGVNISVGNNTENTALYTYPVSNYFGSYNGVSDIPSTYYTTDRGSTSGESDDINLHCISMFGIIQPSAYGEYLGAQFTTSSTVSGYNYVLGYHVESLGQVNNLSISQIQSIVNNATNNLATTSSVSEVQSSVNELKEKVKVMQEEQEKTNNTLTDDDTTESTNKANEFFSGFTTDTFGLTSIITAPLTLIGSITSSTCSPLSLDIPFLSKNNKLSLPCMSSIYQENFGSFLTIYQSVTFGIVAYWVCVRVFALVKGFKNPDEDKIEVLDL